MTENHGPHRIGDRVIAWGTYEGTVSGHNGPYVLVKLDKEVGGVKVSQCEPSELRPAPKRRKHRKGAPGVKPGATCAHCPKLLSECKRPLTIARGTPDEVSVCSLNAPCYRAAQDAFKAKKKEVLVALLDSIKAKAREEIASKSEEDLRAEVKKGIAKARTLLPAEANKVATYAVGKAAIDALESQEEELGGLGMWGLTAFSAELAMGNEHEAEMIYLQKEADWDEIFAAIDSAQEGDLEAKRRREAAKAAAKSVIKVLGKATGAALLPYLIGAVGL